MGELWAVLLRMKTVGSALDEKSFYGVANKRDGCTMVSFSRSKRKFRLGVKQRAILVSGLHSAVAGNREHSVVNLDKLTYAGNLNNLEQIATEERYSFVHGDIADRKLVCDLLQQYQPRAIVHFAAESHVDRSIHGPDDFIRTNVNGTFALLEEARACVAEMP